MGMFGILVMIGENELSSAGVYTKVRSWACTVNASSAEQMNSSSKYLHVSANTYKAVVNTYKAVVNTNRQL